MAKKLRKPFETLVVRYCSDCSKTSVFTVDSKIGDWIDPYDDTIAWNEFSIYGIMDTEEDMDKVCNEDFSSAIKMGSILGCHISKSLIVDLGADPYAVCDNADVNLEAMYSVLQEYEDDFEHFEFYNHIYFIKEIELFKEYHGFDYEKILLKQLPAIIVRSLHVFPSLLLHFPQPARYKKVEMDEDADAILLHRMNYRMRNLLKTDNDDNISLFPPLREVSQSEINYRLGRRNPGDAIPAANRNQELYRLYKSVGFKEIGKTGWLYKMIANIHTLDGLNH